MDSPDTDQVIIDARAKNIKKSPIYFFTWAQENTPVHKEFFDYMKQYAEYRGAEIGVIAGRYRHKNSIHTWNSDEPSWATEVLPYLTLKRHGIHKYLSVLADVKILPTAMMPMTGFEGFESEVSIIIGHPKIQLKVVPTLEGYRKKEIYTTGACTLMNYTDSKAGKKGEFHHTLGFVVVETDGDEFYMRHVTAIDDGSFIDLNTSVDSKGITKGDFVSLYVCGDKHYPEVDSEMEEAGRKMMKIFKPDYVRLDDVFNSHSISHHEKKFPIKLYQRYKKGESILRKELDELKSALSWYNEQDFKVIVTKSNHDVFLDKHIDSGDWKKDIPNALEYIQCAAILLENKAPKGLIPYFINQWYPNIIALSDNESFRVNGWEQAIHGDRGSNGSRGSIVQFKRLSTKMITAHTHSPSRYDGVITVGTNTPLRAGYNVGPSSWALSDAIVHKNGKSQQLIFHNYKCTVLL